MIFLLFIAPNLKQKVRVRLINAQGLEEAGVDGGGLFRYSIRTKGDSVAVPRARIVGCLPTELNKVIARTLGTRSTLASECNAGALVPKGGDCVRTVVRKG